MNLTLRDASAILNISRPTAKSNIEKFGYNADSITLEDVLDVARGTNKPLRWSFKKAITIAITNQKGGVGKTNVSLNLAYFLHHVFGLRVLLASTDPQGNLTETFARDMINSPYSMLQLVEQKLNGENIDYNRYVSKLNIGIDHISTDLNFAKVESISELEAPLALREVFEDRYFQDAYDVIIVDTPPTTTTPQLMALAACDYVYGVMVCDMQALSGFKRIELIIKKADKAFKEHTKILGIITTQADERTTFDKKFIEHIKGEYPEIVFNTNVPRSQLAKETFNLGKSIFQSNEKQNRVRAAYIEVFSEIAQQLKTIGME